MFTGARGTGPGVRFEGTGRKFGSLATFMDGVR